MQENPDGRAEVGRPKIYEKAAIMSAEEST